MPADPKTRLADLLQAAGTAHHHAFAATNGDDPEWPAWYAHWLLPQLGGLLSIGELELAAVLTALDHEHRARKESRPWPEFYAERLLREA